MGFGILIILRILFVACMVFIIGNIFGGFSKKPTLRIIGRVATILVIVLFFISNVLFMRMAFAHHHGNGPWCHDREEVKTTAPQP
ncbi:MAG: hypothetical protein J7623_16175 [Chitinophaga sp.]|uniref:hypothetical protein n=1 Tax=Chitinophaga sp. TaxID=1869181 RepID=UPI001B21C18F|nr:hypothetical protein [Chitinophaga sp.]MBO9730177.1 hypothetical protein [Chitinophaga sp.]